MKHIRNWLKHTGHLTSPSGVKINILHLDHHADQKILSAWAKHFREQYCSLVELDSMLEGTEHATRRDFLLNEVFPSAKPLGKAVRSGDFSETLVSDYLQFILSYWVPRTRLENKTVRDQSVQGCDVVGFKIKSDKKWDPSDSLIIFECKAHLRSTQSSNILQNAISGSANDIALKLSETLNAQKRRLQLKEKSVEAARIQRFQNRGARPYKQLSGAVAVVTSSAFNTRVFTNTDVSSHPNVANLTLLVIHGTDLKDLANKLYEIAANEA